MAYASFQDFCAGAGLAAPEGFARQQEDWTAAVHAGRDETFPAWLRREAGASEGEYLDRLAHAFGWGRVKLADEKPSGEARKRLPTKVAAAHQVIPVRITDGVLEVAASDPFNTALLNAVRFAARGPVRFLLAPREDLERAYEKYYGVGADTIDELARDDAGEEEGLELLSGADQEIGEGGQEASIIKFVNQIIIQAYKSRATDIHIEPQQDELRIRHRIDGMLHQMPLPPQMKQLQSKLISRIKILSKMNIAEKRLPQDGHIGLSIKGDELDIRVSTVPAEHGESVSLRLLSRGSILKGMDTLGMSARIEKTIREIINRPHGITLVTGPTGSGKSTSLYAFLNAINSVDQRIMTVEDPVEYKLKGINQVEVKSEIGLNFAQVLRHFLRQDPDVIMVGEIRDGETAQIAIQAANTGHLVFSTLHTNDAASAYTRLIDMGAEPFLLADAIIAIMAQRLVGTICEACRVEHAYPPEYLLKLGFPAGQIGRAQFYKGAGCDKCGQIGYRGRVGLYELLVPTDEVRRLVISREPASVIVQRARADGMMTLREDAWEKVLAGRTTVEEILRITQIEDARGADASAGS